MSTEPIVRPRVARRAGTAFVVTCAVTAVRAAEVDFRPAMSFGVFHDGNISVIGGSKGDELARLAIDFAVDRATADSTLSFAYRPSYAAYHRAKDLDYFANTLLFGFERELSRSSRFYLNTYASRTDYQGLTQDTKDKAITFVPRTTLTEANVSAGGSSSAGRRGFVDWEFHAAIARYVDVKDDPATTTVDEAKNFNNSSAFDGRVAWRGELSARNTLGIGLILSHFGYELTPDVNIASIGLVGTSQVASAWQIDYAAGVSRTKSDNDSANGFSFNATVDYFAGKSTTFKAGLRQVFAPGTGLGGSTQDRGGWISYIYEGEGRGLSGSVVGGYWQRDELQFNSSAGGATTTPNDTESYTVDGSIGWNFNRYLALAAAYGFIDQNGRNGAPASLDTKYSSYGVYLRWAIRGR